MYRNSTILNVIVHVDSLWSICRVEFTYLNFLFIAIIRQLCLSSDFCLTSAPCFNRMDTHTAWPFLAASRSGECWNNKTAVNCIIAITRRMVTSGSFGIEYLHSLSKYCSVSSFPLLAAAHSAGADLEFGNGGFLHNYMRLEPRPICRGSNEPSFIYWVKVTKSINAGKARSRFLRLLCSGQSAEVPSAQSDS